MDYTEKTLAYLENELSATERENFENALKNDQTLQRELDFQKELINGIKSVRKAELKAMLNAVPVTGPASFSTGQYFTGLLVAALLSGGTYYLWPQSSEEISSGPSIELKSSDNETLADETIADQADSKPDNSNERVSNANEIQIPEEQPDVEKQVGSDEEKELIASDPTITTPEIPQLGSTESDNEEISDPQNELLKSINTENESLEILVVNDEKFDFHYLFKNSKLYLYGTFEDTYEILDFNKDGNRALYLFTNNSYHPLDVNSKKITALRPLEEKILITELDKMRNK